MKHLVNQLTQKNATLLSAFLLFLPFWNSLPITKVEFFPLPLHICGWQKPCFAFSFSVLLPEKPCLRISAAAAGFSLSSIFFCLRCFVLKSATLHIPTSALKPRCRLQPD